MRSETGHRHAWIASAAGFLVAYLLLEASTYRADVAPLGVTPWNPSAGLSLGLLLWKGLAWAPLLALALVMTDVLIRNVPFPWWVEAIEVAFTVASYSTAAGLLRSSAAGFDRKLGSMRDLLLLVLATVIVAVVVAIAYVAVLSATGLLPLEQLADAVLRHWAGDVIGIMAVTPFLLLMPIWSRWRPELESALQALAILAAVSIVAGGEDGLRQQLFYLLFLPIVWIAVRHGLAGASAGLFVMQVGLMIALHSDPASFDNVAALQAVLLILLLAGLAIGVLTSERQVVAARLRRQQALVQRVARSAGMGSLSSGIAHEMSQPLTAVRNYTRAALRALEASPPRIESARTSLVEAVAQVDRAAEVIRKLRGLFEVGRVDLASHDLHAIVAEAAALMGPDAAENAVELRLPPAAERVPVLADRVQIVLVLVNLLRNALEAVAEVKPSRRRISIDVHPLAGDPRRVAVDVVDTGPGLPPEFDLATHQLGQSEKPGGLGVGLALCRSIVEAHGGSLTATEPPGGGTAITFTLERTDGDGHAGAT
ncbi:MAG: sensor histidine kinase [Hyphomicrobiaceae bacterium]